MRGKIISDQFFDPMIPKRWLVNKGGGAGGRDLEAQLRLTKIVTFWVLNVQREVGGTTNLGVSPSPSFSNFSDYERTGTTKPFSKHNASFTSYWGLVKDFLKSDCVSFLRAFILHSYDLWHTGGVKPCTLQFWHGQYLMKAEMHFKIWDLGFFRRSNLSPIL